ncbi:hypothetical protein GLOIN_2v1488498 [Rhizophagus irregularis DAOM 181602=DAOM 197198]|nr:hypothetical protein GLOIN_2v1488498 [Rhizophagus irregularis DAOM 181602=DAOM 197198]
MNEPIFSAVAVGEHKLSVIFTKNIDVGTNEIGLELVEILSKLRKENTEIPELREKLLRFAEVETENARGSAVDGMALSFGQTQNDEEAREEAEKEAERSRGTCNQDVTKIPEVTDMLTSEQVKQDLSQSYEASSE